MFERHILDEDGRLQRLFWCDGESQLNYEVFGDVAFDVTYRKNKYIFQFVIFSGVNQADNCFCNWSCFQLGRAKLCVIAGTIEGSYERETSKFVHN